MHIILDGKYKKSDLKKVMNEQFQHLSTGKRERLLVLLRMFEYIFGGKLCM